MKKNWKILVGILISALFIYLFFKDTQKNEIAAKIGEAKLWAIILAVIVYFLSMVIRSYRWHFLLKPVKNINPLKLYGAVVVGYAANNLLPLRMGEIVRAYVCGLEQEISKSASFASIILERVFDGLTMIFIITISFLFLKYERSFNIAFILASLIFITALIFFLLLLSKQEKAIAFINNLISFASENIRLKIAKFLGLFIEGLKALQNSGYVLIISISSLLVWLCEGLMYSLISISLGMDQIGFFKNMLVLAAVNIFIMVPAGPGYAGTFDSAAQTMLGILGLSDKNLATAYALLLHISQYLPITILGLFYFWKFNLSLTKIKELKNNL